MIKQALFIAIALVSTTQFGNGAQASPSDTADQATGVLTSPMAQPAAQDPAVQQAVQWIHSKNAAQAEHVVNFVPKHSSARSAGRTMILGGPDVVPM